MKLGRIITLISLVVAFGIPLAGQNALEKRISVHFTETSLEQALVQLLDRYDVPLAFSPDLIPTQKITLDAENQPVRLILEQLLNATRLKFRLDGPYISIYLAAPKTRTFTISGFLSDIQTGERLIGAGIWVPDPGQGTTTNEYGFYSLSLPEGEKKITFSYLGYDPLVRTVELDRNIRLDLELGGSLTLQEVVVVAEDSLHHFDTRSDGAFSIPVSVIENMPALGGEADLIRTVHFLPGVQTGTDGLEGIHVRGGGPGE